MLRTPTAVLITIGQMAVMKITNRADGFASCSAASEIGSQARGGTVRSTWKIGSRAEWANRLDPTRTPRATPTTAENPNPIATRCRLVSACQNRPLSTPPRSKNGLKISSFDSSQMVAGAGSPPGSEPLSPCQSSRMTRRVTAGGRIAPAT